MFYVYIMIEKVEMMVFENLDEAHKYCQNPPHFSTIYIIWEGDIEKSFDGHHGVPLAMYVNAKRYSVIEQKINTDMKANSLIIDEVGVTTLNNRYLIKRYKDTSIKVFNLESGTYEAAHPILRQINEELKLGIDIYPDDRETGKNTRQLGYDVINALKDKGY